MSILKKVFAQLKGRVSSGSIEAPTPTVIRAGLHSEISRRLKSIEMAMWQIESLDELLQSPKVEYVEGFHTKVAMVPIKGLGIITIIFSSETGEPLCAELKEEE